MNTNKKKVSLLLVVFIAISMISWVNTNLNALDPPPAPKLVEYIADGGVPKNLHSYANNTNITVIYSVDRFAGVDGVLLVGEGANLTTNLEDALQLNKSHSLRDKTYYNATFKLFESVKFKAYAYIGNLTNSTYVGTYEQNKNWNHLEDWNYIFNKADIQLPVFYKINIPTVAAKTYYVDRDDKNVTIHYRLTNGNISNPEPLTLVLSVYRDIIENGSIAGNDMTTNELTVINMQYDHVLTTQLNASTPYYNATFTMSEKLIYFSANSTSVWDFDAETSKLNIYKIYNGFYFNSELKELEDKSKVYTNVDDVIIRVNAYNSSDNDVFGLYYRVVESSTNDTAIMNWTQVIFDAPVEYKNVTLNTANNYNSTLKVFEHNLGRFNTSNKIYFEAFNLYYGIRYNETDKNYHTLIIKDALPVLTMTPKNNAYLNRHEVTFNFTIDFPRGNITEILIDFGTGDPLENITDFTKRTISHNYTEGITEVYNFTLYVNTTLGVANNITHTLTLDFENPNCIINYEKTTNTNDTVSTTGYVELHFEATDNVGLRKVHIHWGDGSVWNATGDSKATHRYMISGTFDVRIEVIDLAGNGFNTTITFVVELPEPEQPRSASFSLFALLGALIVITPSINHVFRKRKTQVE